MTGSGGGSMGPKKNTIVWASIRADHNIPPFTNTKSITAICLADFMMDGEGAEHLEAFLGIDILDYARADSQEGGGGGGVNTGQGGGVVLSDLTGNVQGRRVDKDRQRRKGAVRETGALSTDV